MISSLLTMRAHGDYDRYLASLTPAFRELIVSLVPSQWLPIDVAHDHYRACWALGLSRREIAERGMVVTKHIHNVVLALGVRMAKEAGVTPWAVFARLDKLWERIWRGGSVSVIKQGPKDALIEVVQFSCAREPYCRAAMPSVVASVMEMFCRRAYVTDVSPEDSPYEIRLHAAWV